jgi:hypothetical protein
VKTRTNLDRSLELKQNRLRDEDLASLGAEIADLCLKQLHLLSRAATPHLQEPIDDRVQINLLVGHDVRPLVKIERGKRRKEKERDEKHTRGEKR